MQRDGGIQNSNFNDQLTTSAQCEETNTLLEHKWHCGMSDTNQSKLISLHLILGPFRVYDVHNDRVAPQVENRLFKHLDCDHMVLSQDKTTVNTMSHRLPNGTFDNTTVDPGT